MCECGAFPGFVCHWHRSKTFVETAFELVRSNDEHAADFAAWEEELKA